MVPSLVFFAALAASTFGHHIAVMPLSLSPMAKGLTSTAALSPLVASMSIADGLSAARAASDAEEAARALGIHAAKTFPSAHAFYAASPAAPSATILSSASTADPFGRYLSAAKAIDAAELFRSTAATPASLADILAAKKSTVAGAPAPLFVVSASPASPFATARAIEAASPDAAAFGLPAAAPGSLAHALAAAKSIEAGVPTTLMVPVSSASPFATVRAIEAASPDAAAFGLRIATPGSLAHALAATKSIEAGVPPTIMVPVSSASPFAAARAIEAAPANPAAFGSPAEDYHSLAHALAVAKSNEAASRSASAFLPAHPAFPWARSPAGTKYDDAASPSYFLMSASAVDPKANIFAYKALEDDASAAKVYAPSWARALAAEKYLKAAGPAGDIYAPAQTTAALAAAKAADRAAALYGSYVADSDCSSAASPLICALATGKAIRDAASGAVLTSASSVSPMSSWISGGPGSPATAYVAAPFAGTWAP